MTVITVAQQKGGAGKTTLAIQIATALAARGKGVAVVDIDPQASLTGWMRLREHGARDATPIRLSMVGGWRLGAEIERLRREAEFIVVDSPPHAAAEAKEAIRAADVVLVPCQPSVLDVWASKATVEAAVKEGRRPFLVLNRVPPRGKSLDEARDAIEKAGYPALSARLGNRQAFVNGIARGLGVVESEPKSAAADEVRALVDELGAALA
ncbi:MAG: ParA family protein [Geminicoccaceae bacterium]|nr:ParA family protein [Geminicoccaceae bacterium]